MDFCAALALAQCGVAVTRSGWKGQFWIVRSGKSLMGRYIGETGFTRMRAGEPDEEDRRASDWQPFIRSLPDDWEGCDAADGRHTG